MTVKELIEKHRDRHYAKDKRTGETLEESFREFAIEMLEMVKRHSCSYDSGEARDAELIRTKVIDEYLWELVKISLAPEEKS